ncbi:MAG: excinuclease ABC subunit UvrC [Candidatus Helarchaeota archaeon]
MNVKNEELMKKINKLPLSPGCYLFKNEKDEIIYVGKAISLKKRVSSYFRSNLNFESYPKLKQLVAQIRDVEIQKADSEIEALILETNLIKKIKPKFNSLMKDDKSHPYVHITTNEKFPRILIMRLTKNEPREPGVYFGPFMDMKLLERSIDYLLRVFPASDCKRPIKENDRFCTRFQYKKCPGPCIGEISKEEYDENVKNIILFLSGKKEELLKDLHDKMDAASKNLQFEIAAEYRDKIRALERVVQNVRLSPETKTFFLSESVKELKKLLKLPKTPMRIAGFDIGGSETGLATGACVIFENGLPMKEEYRRYRMRSQGPNDYAMMAELIKRRYQRVLTEKLRKPDLILIDGGLGQVNMAKEVLNQLGLNKIQICGLAKEHDFIYFPFKNDPMTLPLNSKALFLLQRVRDEAHRFAISYYKKLRRKGTFESILDGIPGIGKKRKQALLKKFGSIQNIKAASLEELEETPLISNNQARIIRDFFIGEQTKK